MLLKLAAVGGILALSGVQAMAQETIDIRGQQIPLSCGDWRKDSNDTWTMVGILNAGGASVTGLKIKGGKEVAALDKMCK